MSARTLSPAMLRELRYLNRWGGEPTGPEEWHGAGALWFRNRDRVIGALHQRGLIEPSADGWPLTDAGRAAIARATGSGT